MLDVDSDAKTENTRSAYPTSFLPNFIKSGMAGHPKTIVMLTADAFGVLPPIARLSPEQAMYHFLSGYTAKVAGTERGVTEPTATFSTCFGAPFMVHHPTVYAKLLGERIAQHGVRCWLVNTGWTGGAYGTGKRMKIAYTRSDGQRRHRGPARRRDLRARAVLRAGDPDRRAGRSRRSAQPAQRLGRSAAYDAQAKHLAGLFADNFAALRERTPPPALLAAAIKR